MKNRINTKKTILIFVLLFILIIAIDVIFMKDYSFNAHYSKMDTVIDISGYGSDMDRATRDILKAIDEIDLKMNIHNVKSNLYALNKNKKADYDKDTAELISISEEIRKKSDGAFNIAVRTISEEWGFGTDFPAVPNEDKIKKAIETVNGTEIGISADAFTLNQGKIDLGGIAKGFATDKAKEILASYKEIDYAVLNFGGNILTYGKKPDGSKFKIGINDGKDGVFATISVDNAFIITSGGYERYFEQDGKKYHHILDPKTGYPAQTGLVSVTIISDNGALADALSTACYVLGAEKGTELAESYGVKAVFLDENNNVYIVGDVEIELVSTEYKIIK